MPWGIRRNLACCTRDVLLILFLVLLLTSDIGIIDWTKQFQPKMARMVQQERLSASSCIMNRSSFLSREGALQRSRKTWHVQKQKVQVAFRSCIQLNLPQVRTRNLRGSGVNSGGDSSKYSLIPRAKAFVSLPILDKVRKLCVNQNDLIWCLHMLESTFERGLTQGWVT